MADVTRPPGLILAGGKSSRMGEDKAFVTIGGHPLIEHIVRRLTPQVCELVLNAPADLPNPLNLPLVPDRLGGQIGPLAGVLTGLRNLQARGADTPHLLTVPSDSPFVPLDLVDFLTAGADDAGTIVIAASDGRNHPVFGLWPLSIADDLQAWLGDPANRRIKAFLERHRVETVDFALIDTPYGCLDPFLNINTPEELEEARRFADLLS